MSATVVGGRENCEKLTTGESLEAVHHTFVSSKDLRASIRIKEVLNSIGAKFDNISCTIGISDEIRLNSKI